MSTVTVPRADLTTEEVVTVLRDGLGPDYNVLPGMAMRRLPFLAPREGRPNKIVVGTGDNRVVKAQVTITPGDGGTEVRISPGRLHDHLRPQHLRHRAQGPRGAGGLAAPVSTVRRIAGI
jgi:hypothetical protein